MTYGVVGCRHYTNYIAISNILQDVFKIAQNKYTIVTGDASGVDFLARQYAKQHHIACASFEANWDKFGKSAGPIRNKKIVKACDELIAFWDGISKGTKNSIKFAIDMKKPIHIYWI